MSMRITGLAATQRALKKEIDKLRTSRYALVGIHESAGQAKDSQMTMATLGAVQHFGNDDIPARRWLDTGAESGTKDYLDVIREGVEKGLTAQQIMKKVGVEAEGAIREYMTELDEPANAPSTVKRKGSSNPLIDTGAMRQSVTSTVVRKKPQEGIG